MLQFIKNQWIIFLNSLQFFTIIPLKIRFTPPEKIIRYFSLTGFLIAVVGFIFFTLGYIFWEVHIGVIFSLIAMTFLTGGLHEDGFADTVDGLGGGWEKIQILKIMKDSRIGSFGTLGLLFLMAFKFCFLIQIDPSKIFGTLVLAQMSSRGFSVLITVNTRYAREKKIRYADRCIFINSVIGTLPFFVVEGLKFWAIAIVLFLAVYFLRKIFIKKIGGYTGDCLGATQQICEVLVYLVLSAKI